MWASTALAILLMESEPEPPYPCPPPPVVASPAAVMLTMKGEDDAATETPAVSEATVESSMKAATASLTRL